MPEVTLASAELAALKSAAEYVVDARAAIGRAAAYRARGWPSVASCALDTAAASRRAAVAYRRTAAVYGTLAAVAA